MNCLRTRLPHFLWLPVTLALTSAAPMLGCGETQNLGEDTDSGASSRGSSGTSSSSGSSASSRGSSEGTSASSRGSSGSSSTASTGSSASASTSSGCTSNAQCAGACDAGAGMCICAVTGECASCYEVDLAQGDTVCTQDSDCTEYIDEAIACDNGAFCDGAGVGPMNKAAAARIAQQAGGCFQGAPNTAVCAGNVCVNAVPDAGG